MLSAFLCTVSLPSGFLHVIYLLVASGQTHCTHFVLLHEDNTSSKTFMGRFSLQAEATSPTLVYMFVKATTTPSSCFSSEGMCRFVWDKSEGLGKDCLGLEVPTHARGGGCSMSLPSRDTLNVQCRVVFPDPSLPTALLCALTFLLSPGLSQPSRAAGCPHGQLAISSCSCGTMMHFPDIFLLSAYDIG